MDTLVYTRSLSFFPNSRIFFFLFLLVSQSMAEAMGYPQKLHQGPSGRPLNGEMTGPSPQQRMTPTTTTQQRSSQPQQSHLPLPIPQGHPQSGGYPTNRPPPHRGGNMPPTGMRPSSGGMGGYEDPWRGGPPPSLQGESKPKAPSQPKGRPVQGQPSNNNNNSNNNTNNSNSNSNNNNALHGPKLVGNFQDPAIMMMSSQGLPYGGNPWGLDPGYGAAYSMPAGLPPGLVMPLMAPQGPAGGLGATPPGFPFGVGGPAVAYARGPVSQPKSNKYLQNPAPPSNRGT